MSWLKIISSMRPCVHVCVRDFRHRLQMFRLPPSTPPPILSLSVSPLSGKEGCGLCLPSRARALTRTDAPFRAPSARRQSLRCRARRRVLPPLRGNHALAAVRGWNVPIERALPKTHLWICAAEMPPLTKPLFFLLCLLVTGECRRHGHRVRRWTGAVESQNHGT